MTCRTLHPDPQRLLTLGEAARAAGVSHLALRRSVQSGLLPTLPALHLGQRIRLVEPAALLAAYPESECDGRPPLDPEHRGIEWIGASPEDEPPQGASPVAVPAREERAYELPRVNAGGPGTEDSSPHSSSPGPAQVEAATSHASTPEEVVPTRPDGLEDLVSAEFGGSGRPSTSAGPLAVTQPVPQGPSTATLEAPRPPAPPTSTPTRAPTPSTATARASDSGGSTATSAPASRCPAARAPCCG